LLTGENILLRALEPKDLPDLVAWENNTENWKVSERLQPYSTQILQAYLNNAQTHILSSGQFRYVIEEVETGNAIGCIDLFDYNALHGRVGVGILIESHSKRRKGYATQALSILLAYCTQHLMVHQVYCSISESNSESISLFTKLGFEKTGTRKNWNRTPNGFEDIGFYQIILS